MKNSTGLLLFRGLVAVARRLLIKQLQVPKDVFSVFYRFVRWVY